MSGVLTNAERSRVENREREAATRANVVRQLGFAARPLTAQEVHRRCFPQSGERAYGWDSTLSRLRDMAAEGLVVEVGGRWSTPARSAPTAPERQPEPEPVADPPAPIEAEPIAAPAAPEPQPSQESPMSEPRPAASQAADLLMASCIEASRTYRPRGDWDALATLLVRAMMELRTGPRQVGILATLIGARGAEWRSVVDTLSAQGWASRVGSGRVAQLALTDAGAALVPSGGITDAQKAPARERPDVLAALVRSEPGRTPGHYRDLTGWTRSQIDHAARGAVEQGLIVRWGSAPDLRYYTPDKVPTATRRTSGGRRQTSSEPAAPMVEVEPAGGGLNLHGGMTSDEAPAGWTEGCIPGPAVEAERHGPAMPLVADDRSEAASCPDPMLAGFAALADRLAKAEALLAKIDELIDGAASTLADHVRLRAADKAAVGERFVALEAQVGVLTRAAESHGDSIGSLEQSHSDARLRLADLDTIAILHGKEIDAIVERAAGPHDVAAIAERLDTVETDVASFVAARQADAARLEEAMQIITATGERIAGAMGPLLRIAEVREGETGEGIVVLRGTRRDVREAVERCGAFGVVRLVSGGR